MQYGIDGAASQAGTVADVGGVVAEQVVLKGRWMVGFRAPADVEQLARQEISLVRPAAL